MPALYSLFAYWLFITDSKKPPNLSGCVGSMKGDRSFHGMHRGNDAGTLTRSRRGHQCLGAASRGDGRLRRLTGRAIVNAASHARGHSPASLSICRRHANMQSVRARRVNG